VFRPRYLAAVCVMGLFVAGCQEPTAAPLVRVDDVRDFEHAIVVSGDRSATLGGWGRVTVDRHTGTSLDHTMMVFSGPRSFANPDSVTPLDNAKSTLLLELYGPFEPGEYSPQPLTGPLTNDKQFVAVFGYVDGDGLRRTYRITSGKVILRETASGYVTATLDGQSELGFKYIPFGNGTSERVDLENEMLRLQVNLVANAKR